MKKTKTAAKIVAKRKYVRRMTVIGQQTPHATPSISPHERERLMNYLAARDATTNWNEASASAANAQRMFVGNGDSKAAKKTSAIEAARLMLSLFEDRLANLIYTLTDRLAPVLDANIPPGQPKNATTDDLPDVSRIASYLRATSANIEQRCEQLQSLIDRLEL